MWRRESSLRGPPVPPTKIVNGHPNSHLDALLLHAIRPTPRCATWPENSALMSAARAGRTRPPSSTSGLEEMLAHGWERNLKDVGDQALMPGLGTAVSSVRPGLSRCYNGHRLKVTTRLSGIPAAAPPPPVPEIHPPVAG
jgi:hypothetical protein